MLPYSGALTSAETSYIVEVYDLLLEVFDHFRDKIIATGDLDPGVDFEIDRTTAEYIAHSYVLRVRAEKLHDVQNGLDANKKVSLVTFLIAKYRPLYIVDPQNVGAIGGDLHNVNLVYARECFLSGMPNVDFASLRASSRYNEICGRLNQVLNCDNVSFDALETIAYFIREMYPK